MVKQEFLNRETSMKEKQGKVAHSARMRGAIQVPSDFALRVLTNYELETKYTPELRCKPHSFGKCSIQVSLDLICVLFRRSLNWVWLGMECRQKLFLTPQKTNSSCTVHPIALTTKERNSKVSGCAGFVWNLSPERWRSLHGSLFSWEGNPVAQVPFATSGQFATRFGKSSLSPINRMNLLILTSNLQQSSQSRAQYVRCKFERGLLQYILRGRRESQVIDSSQPRTLTDLIRDVILVPINRMQLLISMPGL